MRAVQQALGRRPFGKRVLLGRFAVVEHPRQQAHHGIHDKHGR